MKTTNRLSIARLGKNMIAVMYASMRLVWQAIRSCFGAGYWVDDKPWVDDEAWRD